MLNCGYFQTKQGILRCVEILIGIVVMGMTIGANYTNWWGWFIVTAMVCCVLMCLFFLIFRICGKIMPKVEFVFVIVGIVAYILASITYFVVGGTQSENKALWITAGVFSLINCVLFIADFIFFARNLLNSGAVGESV